MGPPREFLQRVGHAVRLEGVGGVGDDVRQVVHGAEQLDHPLGVQPVQRGGDARRRGIPLRPLVPREHASQPRVRVLHVVDRVLVRLPARQIEVEGHVRVALPHEEEPAGDIHAHVVEELPQRDHAVLARREPHLLAVL